MVWGCDEVWTRAATKGHVMSVVWAVAWSHVDVLMSTGHAATGWWAIDMSGLPSLWRSCWCPWSGSLWGPCLDPRSYYSQGLCPWSALSSETTWKPKLAVKRKEATFAVTSMTADTQLRNRDIEGFCDKLYPLNSPPPKKWQPKQETQEEHS